MPRKRRVFDPAFKAKVALESIRGSKTVSELASLYEVYPQQISLWRKHLSECASALLNSSEARKDSSNAERTVTPEAVDLLLQLLPAEFSSESRKIGFLDSCQAALVEKVREYHQLKRIEFDFDPALSGWATVHAVLEAAEKAGKCAAVAQYLVGAKLAIRFPELEIANERASASDDSTGRAGDFEIGDTVFHVTVSPTAKLLEKCGRNLARGLRVYLLAPDQAILTLRNMAEFSAPHRVTSACIEGFVSQNIEELAQFRQSEFVSGFRRLLECYNRRVSEIETDKSLLMEIPPNI